MIRIFDVHLASSGSSRERAAQAQLLTGCIAEERLLAEEEAEPYRVVVIGDLNAHEEPTTLEPLEAAGFVDCWRVAEMPPMGAGFTAPVHDPAGRIDYVLIEEQDACEQIEVPDPDESWQRLSDHWPVVATVRLS
jgi:endonuclease/exonuclease/phosphatase family metal-dependent hydrolase